MRIFNMQQGSLEWAKLRCGKITMSRAKDLLTGGKGITRMNYIFDVVAERLSGEPIDGYYGIDMERGNFLEEWAINALQEHLNVDVQTIGFVCLDKDDRIGCSPDGLIEGYKAGVEIKCPKPRQHIKNALYDGFNDYAAQVQGQMWICEKDHWYLASFCPWVKQMPLHVLRLERNDEIIKKLSESALNAADTVDEIVKEATTQQPLLSSVAAIADEARDAWDNVLADNDQVQI